MPVLWAHILSRAHTADICVGGLETGERRDRTGFVNTFRDPWM